VQAPGDETCGPAPARGPDALRRGPQSRSTGAAPLNLCLSAPQPVLICTVAVATGGLLAAQEGLHFGDLALLCVYNALGELSGIGILPGAQLSSLSYRDSPLMMGDHHL
jgi:hypothetical protein